MTHVGSVPTLEPTGNGTETRSPNGTPRPDSLYVGVRA